MFPGAVSYLRHIAAVEGHDIPSSIIGELYTNPKATCPTRFEYPDKPMHPVVSQIPSKPDLRAALSQLQVLCLASSPKSGLMRPFNPPREFEEVADWSQRRVDNFRQPDSLSSQGQELRTLSDLNRFVNNVSYADIIRQSAEDEMEVSLPFLAFVSLRLLSLTPLCYIFFLPTSGHFE